MLHVRRAAADLHPEVQVIALQDPQAFGAYLNKAAGDWHDLALRSMSDSLKSSSLATLCIAVFDGLLLELMATGDHRRLTAALDEFIHLVARHRASERGEPAASANV